MGRIVERSQELLDEPGGWGASASTPRGQLFLEEYYTLGVIGKAGIGTPHMDGNTRLCTATAAAALKESFGTDGQPGSYDGRRPLRRARPLGPQRRRDADGAVVADARPPPRARPAALLCVDPRDTPVAREADVHLAPRAAPTSRCSTGCCAS